MFDSPHNRFIYDCALERHEELMAAKTEEGDAYRSGFNGENHRPLLSYPVWRAGRHNATLT